MSIEHIITHPFGGNDEELLEVTPELLQQLAQGRIVPEMKPYEIVELSEAEKRLIERPRYMSLDPASCPVIDATKPLSLIQAVQWTLQQYGTLDPKWQPLRDALARELEGTKQEVKITIDVKPLAIDVDKIVRDAIKKDARDLYEFVADTVIDGGVAEAKRKFDERNPYPLCPPYPYDNVR